MIIDKYSGWWNFKKEQRITPNFGEDFQFDQDFSDGLKLPANYTMTFNLIDFLYKAQHCGGFEQTHMMLGFKLYLLYVIQIEMYTYILYVKYIDTVLRICICISIFFNSTIDHNLNQKHRLNFGPSYEVALLQSPPTSWVFWMSVLLLCFVASVT